MEEPSPATIHLTQFTQDQELTTMHLLPCTIQCTCRDRDNKDCKHPAKVDKFFEPVIRKGCAEEGENETLGDIYTGSFRGRPLKGVLVKVPDGYVGQILKKNCNGRAAFPEEGSVFEVRNSFNELHYWNLQNRPTSDDKLMQALKYTRLANTLHKAVTPDSQP